MYEFFWNIRPKHFVAILYLRPLLLCLLVSMGSLSFGSSAHFCNGFYSGYAKIKPDDSPPRCPQGQPQITPRADFQAGVNEGMRKAKSS